MPAPKGNQFWLAATKQGRDKIFKSPASLMEVAQEYFQWNEDNPLKESKIFQYQGEIVQASVSKMRAMTIKALCRYLKITYQTWENYKLAKGYEEFFEITREIEGIIYDQKFTGAAAELLSANIIARELGLSEKSDNTLTGPGGGPLQIQEITFKPVKPDAD
jgi:hypothetical protein